MTLPLSEAEFDRQFATASRRGAARRRQQPLATSVRYDADWGVIIELNNHCLVCVPLRLLPELVALVLGLSLYTASFIAEIVRAGIQSVPRGQGEAARALGLRPGAVLRLVTIPQAMRVITPPLTNQFLNLTKNSTLAVFIGYPDLVQTFAGTVLNNTGAAVQVIAITMGVYLVISLATSFAMGVFNARMALKER